MKKRTLCALLSATMITNAFVSCASDQNNPSEDIAEPVIAEPQPDVEETPEEADSGRADVKDNLPDGLTFDGSTIRFLYRKDNFIWRWDVVGTDNVGDEVSDAIWERNNIVEDRFQITFEFNTTQGENLSAITGELKKIVTSGSDDCDIINSTCNTTVANSMYPYMYELSDVKYLDIDQPWWHKEAIENLSMDKNHYRFLMGEYQLLDYLKCGVVYANKVIYENVFGDPDEMYKNVLDYEWTWDRLMDQSEAAYVDANGDGFVNPGDQFGLLWSGGDGLTHMVMSCDPVLYSRDEDGLVNLECINTQRNVEIVDKLIAATKETNGVWLSDLNIDNSEQYFANNTSLFFIGRLTSAVGELLRNMESDYGILPLPMFDTDQSRYVTNIHSSATAISVPKSVAADRIDMIGAVIEALCAESYRLVLTPFIETAMKLKYSRDTLSGQCIDIIFENATINLLEMYSNNVAGIFDALFIGPISNSQNNFSSELAKSMTAAQKGIDKYIESVILKEE